MGEGEKKKKGRRRRREEEKEWRSSQASQRYGNYFEYGYNLRYDLYYESHGFCMGF